MPTYLFKIAATVVLTCFSGLMLLVAVYAHTRTSGFTKQDMAKAPFIRAKATEQLIAERKKEAP